MAVIRDTEIINIGKEAEKLGLLHIGGKNVKQYRCCGKQNVKHRVTI